MNSVSKELYAGIVYSTDARSFWSDLKEIFEMIKGLLLLLHKHVSLLTRGIDSISIYYNKLKSIWEYDLVTLPNLCS